MFYLHVTTNHATLLALFQHVLWVGFAFSCGGPHVTGFVIVGTLGGFVVCFIIIINNSMMMHVVFVVGSMFHGGIALFFGGRKSLGGIARAIIIMWRITILLNGIIITFDYNHPSMIAECDIFQRTNNTVFVVEATTRNGCHQQHEQACLVPPFRRRHRDRGCHCIPVCARSLQDLHVLY